MTTHAELTTDDINFIHDQEVFFVATAPLSDHGHINCSPKGLRDTLHVPDVRHVAYLDLTGSGAETIAHLRENGRITLMFCSFAGVPNILRIYGSGQPLLPGGSRFESLVTKFPNREGARAIILITITSVTNSCGYGVPMAAQMRQRDRLENWLAAKGSEGLKNYRKRYNAHSIDGLPAIP
ncbi:pyridoxamine 5'-phosphate oxidase family protein [Ferrimicrobium sp.]|uniref:pyridoxamine 5'-phosphate oxidase family protein n=1 Tax=Ferrimicrobium sp. TaxID=2926050 RepID=UPI0026042A13|nr:pyridoxamine 5'-phosphate oxidase family protein [Ferrimicrobium sp.]